MTLTVLLLFQIALSREKMAQAKKELAAARLVRKNRKEYALLVGMIDDLPSRAETMRFFLLFFVFGLQ